jgi:MYXO-CTERM domain-containing protein
MLVLWLTAAATAAQIDDGVQAAVFPAGFAFAERQLRDRDFEVFVDHLGGAYDCYDEIGVEDFNLDLAVSSVSIALEGDTVTISVDFGTVRGEDMVIYGEDSDTWDTCPEFEVDLNYVVVHDAKLDLAVTVDVTGGALSLALADTPRLSGTLDMDFDYVPDSLVLYFFEDTLFEIARDELAAAFPSLVASYLGDPLTLGDQYGEFAVDLGLEDAGVSNRALRMSASSTVDWRGSTACPTDERAGDSEGESPTLSFEDTGDSSFGVGVTEGMINELFLTAWRQGYFCFTEEDVDKLLAMVGDSFDPGVAGLAASAWLERPPRVDLDSDGITLTLRGAGLRATGQIDGQTEELIALEGDIRGHLELGVDQALSAFTVDLNALELDVTELRADHLLSGEEDAEAHLESFIEDWAAGWASEQARDITLFSSLYYLWDFVLRVDRLDYTQGGVVVLASLFEADDPEVDTTPPDAGFELIDSTSSAAAFGLYGQDDREGPLSFSYQVNGAGWSAWSEEDVVILEDLEPGVYQFEVLARDSWLNVAPEPAVGWLEVDGMEPAKGCGGRPSVCSSRDPAGGAGALGWLALLGLVALRRRTREEIADR